MNDGVHKIKASELKSIIAESIRLGREHYLILFIGAVIFEGINSALKSAPASIVLNAVFLSVWSAGRISISQTIVLEKLKPTIDQYFIAFSKPNILKRLIPLYILAITSMILFLALILGLSHYLAYFNLLTSNEIRSGMLFSVVLISLVLMSYQFFPFLLLLQNNSWKSQLKTNYIAVRKNFVLLSLLAGLPYFLLMFSVSKLIPIAYEYSLTSFSILSPYLVSSLKIFVTPFFLNLDYLLFKKIFTLNEQEIRIRDIT
jgi:hypothetical protein